MILDLQINRVINLTMIFRTCTCILLLVLDIFPYCSLCISLKLISKSFHIKDSHASCLERVIDHNVHTI